MCIHGLSIATNVFFALDIFETMLRKKKEKNRQLLNAIKLQHFYANHRISRDDVDECIILIKKRERRGREKVS